MILSGRKIGESYSLNKEGIAKKEDIKSDLSLRNLEKYRKINTSKRSKIVAASIIEGAFLFEDEDGDIHIQSLGEFTRSDMVRDIYNIYNLFSAKDIDFESEVTEPFSDGLLSIECHPRVQFIKDLFRDHDYEFLKKMDHGPVLEQVLEWESEND